MGVPITGFEGTVTIDSSAMGKVISWDGTIDFKDNEYGPYIGGDGSTETITSSKSVKGKIEMIVPEATDPVASAAIATAISFGSVALVLDETDGYILTIPVAKINSIAVGTDANGTGKLSFQFRNSGSFTFVPS